MMTNDYVLNGVGYGPVGSVLGQYNFDPGMSRPYRNSKGVSCVTLNTGRKKFGPKGEVINEKKAYPIRRLMDNAIFNPVWNASSMTKEAWVHLDEIISKAARQRLSAWADLAASGSVGGFDAMAKMTYEYQVMTDPGEAQVDMDPVTAGRGDAPSIILRSQPLPVTHSDFYATQRQLLVSSSGNAPYDKVMAEAAARRVAEKIEDTTIGTVDGVSYGTETAGPFPHTGTSTVWGYTNFPYRQTKTDLTTPTGSNPEAVNDDILEMIETMEAAGFYGPYMLYHSTAYTRWLNSDYFRTGSTSVVRTLRERLKENGGIQDIRRLDRLTSGYQLILVNMDSETAQAINGMDITTVMWETIGGMKINWKVMAIQTPLLKPKYGINGTLTSGVLHATTS